MRRRLVLLALALFAAACGSPPAAPAFSFPLTAGSYRLLLSGTQCIAITTGSAPGVSTTLDVTVTLAPSGANVALSAPPHALAGTLSSNGSTMSGTLSGSATIQGARFTTGATETAMLEISGHASSNDRFEGMMTSGTFQVSLTTAGGSATAICQAANFTLRRAA